jgi:hypothetical protein
MSTNFKPFNVHLNRRTFKSDNSVWRHMPRGFTARITPSENEREIYVQLVFCSAKDQFCKKTGQIEAERKERAPLNPRQLNKYLRDAAKKCGGDPEFTDFTYVYKYMV